MIIPLSADSLDTWVNVSRPENTRPLAGISYGNGLFVASGLGGTILTSTDGIQWNKQVSGSSNELVRVKFVNGRFLVFADYPTTTTRAALVGRSGPLPVLTSSDGINWASLTPMMDITYAHGAYWSSSGQRSINLVDWETVSPHYSGERLQFGNNTFLRTSMGRTDYSIDGITWSSGAELSEYPDNELSFQNGIFFVPGYQWFTETSPFPPYTNPVQYYVLSHSTDAKNWQITLRRTDFIRDVAAGGQYYVAAAESAVYYTTNLPAAEWTRVPITVANPETEIPASIAYGNHVFVGIFAGKIYRSSPVDGAFAPEIHMEPKSFSAVVGARVDFFVGVQGSEPMAFQWRKNGTNIPNANLQTLTLTNINFVDAGEYDVVISNSAGFTTSEKALLSIHFADVHNYAGITLRGTTGDKFLLEFQPALDPAGQWQVLTNVVLNSATQIWFDHDSPNQPKRFYRATYQSN